MTDPTAHAPNASDDEGAQNGTDAASSAPTFAELGISPEVAAVLSSQGIETAFPIQAKAVPDGLRGADVCGKARTGSPAGCPCPRLRI